MYLFEFSRVEKQLYFEGNHFLFTQCIYSKKRVYPSRQSEK